jgi:hypothetical protein
MGFPIVPSDIEHVGSKAGAGSAQEIAASLARVRLTMSEIVRSGAWMRHTLGYFSSWQGSRYACYRF